MEGTIEHSEIFSVHRPTSVRHGCPCTVLGWGPLLVVMHLSRRLGLPGISRSVPFSPRDGAEEILSDIKTRSNCWRHNSDRGLQFSGPSRPAGSGTRQGCAGGGRNSSAEGLTAGWPGSRKVLRLAAVNELFAS